MSENNPEAAEEYDWGGDGSDLHEPVAEHVRAALVPAGAPYPPPLSQLLTLGDPRAEQSKAGRAALELSQAHVPDLVRMARDRALNTAMGDQPELWAPVHALEVLAGLDASAHVTELMPLFDVDADWFGERLADVLARAGAAAIEPLAAYIHDRTRWMYGRANAASALPKLAEQHPGLRDQVVKLLAGEIARGPENYPELNGMFLAELLHLKAAEALPAIRQAFERDAVDESIAGDWGSVAAELGQPADKHDPLVHRSRRRWEAHKARMRAMLPPQWSPPPEPTPAAAPKPAKANTRKNKRKMSAASRKANKKKR